MAPTLYFVRRMVNIPEKQKSNNRPIFVYILKVTLIGSTAKYPLKRVRAETLCLRVKISNENHLLYQN